MRIEQSSQYYEGQIISCQINETSEPKEYEIYAFIYGERDKENNKRPVNAVIGTKKGSAEEFKVDTVPLEKIKPIDI